MTSEG